MSNSNIEAIYPLSPLQEGMLFHHLLTPEATAYVVQMSCTFRGDLDVAAFKRAWSRVIERHAVLRTFFTWEQRDKPLQVVLAQMPLPWMQYDWRDLSSAEHENRFTSFLAEDRKRGFDLAQAPLLRFALIQVEENRYRFLWSFHHILLDGWSMPLLLKELFAFYNAYRNGQELELEEPRPFRDYIAWLRRQDPAATEGFWRETLKGFTVPTPLVVDRPSTDDKERDDYSELSVRLSETLTAKLNALAQRNELTLNLLVQGAWAILLSRYSGEQDVLFGATSSGRPVDLSGVESMVGLFINTLPARVRIKAEDLLIPWLKKLQEQQLDARQHEYTPLVSVQGWSEVPRGQSLFESLFIFENYPVSTALREPAIGLQVEDVRVREKTNYPLIAVSAPGPELLLKLGYEHNRFDEATIRSMLGHFQQLLEEIATHPEQRVVDLELLTDVERVQMLREWNNTRTTYAQQCCVHELFESQVEHTPESVAVSFQGGQLTYRELNTRANQLARSLRRLGVGPETLVAICMERSAEMVVAVLGVLKAGGAYVPLDHSYPQDRLSFMLDDSRAAVLLTQQALLRDLPESKALTLCIDRDWDLIKGESTENPARITTARNLAYLIYTSGSTGRPKGVMIEHRGVLNLAAAQIKRFEIQPSSRVLQFASFSFDASVSEFFTALFAGATLVLETQNALMPGPEFAELMRSRGITVVTLPPSILAALEPESLPDLRTIVTAGEVCSKELVSRWQAGRRFINAYGPTESTVCATMGNCVDADQKPSIGRPIDNVRIYLLDEQMHPVPVGVAGELHIAYDGLARGYINRPELSAEKFIPNPFENEAGGRLYRTGDRARYLPDGQIDFLGRIDNQVKVRGYRIEPGEIEQVFKQHPSVMDIVVIVREDTLGDKRLVAYMVARQGQTVEISDLRNFGKEKLPQYMMPSAFVILQSLPLTPNGKVDRRALPEPDKGDAATDAPYLPPQTELERIVAGIWQQVLKIEHVSLNDNFFDLGGHSLLMIQVQGKLRTALKRNIAITELFKYPNVNDLVAYLSQNDERAQPLLTDDRLAKLKAGRDRLKNRSRQKITTTIEINAEGVR
ncbi:MAG TPA: amino acid adenylation domain-containing protein [Pyrinomonadaceae bacterium]|nr:amino acid adenylation domain-containing protein [Pyrinomonadaceae bacterium]